MRTIACLRSFQRTVGVVFHHSIYRNSRVGPKVLATTADQPLLHCHMAVNPLVRPRRTENALPFLAILSRLETSVQEADGNWPDEVRDEAIRRLNRLIRAVRQVTRMSMITETGPRFSPNRDPLI